MAKVLTDAAIRRLIPREKPYKVSDSLGLYLLVKPSGARLWRLKYRVGEKQKALALGQYPETTLAEAREKRDAARKMRSNGVDLSIHRKEEKIRQTVANATTFKAVADEIYQRKKASGMAASTLAKAKWLLGILSEDIGSRPISQIKPFEILAILNRYVAAGHTETAVRLRSTAGQVFRHAVRTQRAEIDPTWSLKDAIVRKPVQSQPAITKPAEVGALLRAIDDYPSLTTRYALQLLMLLFPRPGELRSAEWSEVDLDNAVWEIPAAKTKMRRAHRIPLPPQAIAILRALQCCSGDRKLIIPGGRGRGEPMSENTLNAALRRMGYSKDQVVSHGFRATASTLLSENGFDGDHIEAALAHVEPNAVKRAYKRTDYFEDRKSMMLWWANYLDQLRQQKPQRR